MPVYATTEDRVHSSGPVPVLHGPVQVADHREGRSGGAGRGAARHRAAPWAAISRRSGGRRGRGPASRSMRTNCRSTFCFPAVPPGLPRQLASKHELYGLCRQHGVPAPESVFLSTSAEVAAFAATGTFPVVAKNAEPWVRRRAPVVAGTTVLRTASELLALTEAGGGEPSLVLQDYIPTEHAEDWIVHLYCDANSNCLVLFTGVKVRSWPPHTGATACGYAVPNPALAQMAERFCKQIGFQRGGRPRPAVRSPRRPVQACRLQPADGKPVPAVPDRRWYRRGACPLPRHDRRRCARRAIRSAGAG